MSKLSVASVLVVLVVVAVARPVGAWTPSVEEGIRGRLEAPLSSERARGMYALVRFHDPARQADRELVDRAWFAGTWLERAAALRATCDRHWPAGLSRPSEERILDALDEPDTAARIAAIECLERLRPPERGAKLRAVQLEYARGLGAATPVSLAVLRAISRHPDKRNDVELSRMGTTILGAEVVQITEYGAWILIALAAHGTPSHDRFAASLTLNAESDYSLRARLDRIRAGAGDDEAVADLVETATIAMQPELRREAVELLLALPAPRRAKALEALATRMSDIDGGVRALLVREASREATALPADVVEPLLLRGLADPFPDLRMESAAGLFDRAHAGLLSEGARTRIQVLASAERDSFAKAAFSALLSAMAKAPAPAPPASTATPAGTATPVGTATPAP